MSPDPGRPRHRLYGRSAGKPLSQSQAGRLETLLPKLAMPESAPGTLDPRALFSTSPSTIELEIGFGGAEHLIGQARRRPEHGFLGAEPFLDGVAKALASIEDGAITNIRLRRGDVRTLIEELAPQSLNRVFILFPDPWPKTRHRKRRLIQPDFLDRLARTLKPGARVRFATDWGDYANRALCDFVRDGRYHWQAAAAADWREPPADHVTTRYQEKRLGDCKPVFFDFVFEPGARA